MNYSTHVRWEDSDNLRKSLHVGNGLEKSGQCSRSLALKRPRLAKVIAQE